MKPLLALGKHVWSRLPAPLSRTRPMRYCGDLLHSFVRHRAERSQYHATFFLRNRAELRLISALVNRTATERTVKLAVLGCSNGAEVYSILWTLRSSQPDLLITTEAIDICDAIVNIAKQGRYSLIRPELMDTPIFDRLTSEEMEAIFDKDEDNVTVKPWIRVGINWRVADVCAPAFTALLSRQDIVVANRFLCHMTSGKAERCLRNMSKVVSPGGYLFVSGVDLDVRTRIARELGWQPLFDLVEEIHDGDQSLREGWPCHYWGLEPLDKRRSDWRLRYAAAFQIGSKGLAEE
jgi:chemotaxis methyl-accepting protein methylase